jgi:hypothetical protein
MACIGRSFWVLLSIVFLITGSAFGQSQPKTGSQRKVEARRPGDEPFSPMKLDWAAVELQANYGSTGWLEPSPSMISFMPDSDGRTVICLIQYVGTESAESIPVIRETMKYAFEKYRKGRGWSWLQIRFEEHLLHSSKSD